ncbi:AAA family ATPase [Nocardiopsis quinghaiensis]|uniref:AAA family ATPase n=1 Tax=Nocardiopsis quinghaiensis TaxID=464995 RepID=UPI001239C89B|nr:AAA family ATPase [Nocardiopsis quinghaiensis]
MGTQTPPVTTYLELSPHQHEVLKLLDFEGNHLVHGPAGSGKSVVAVYRAAMLSLTGVPVTLLSRSNVLRQQAARLVESVAPQVNVATFDSWLRQWFRSVTGSDLPAPEDASSPWEIDWSSALVSLAGQDEVPSPGALVIDEGQDLPPTFYVLCALMKAQVTVLADENQTITDTNSTLDEIQQALQANVLALTGNHRNTRQVAALAAYFHPGTDTPTGSLSDGPSPTLTHYSSWNDLATRVRGYLRSRPEETVGMIVARSFIQRKLMTAFARIGMPFQVYVGAGHPRYRTLDPFRTGLSLLTRTSAKGLEFDSVFVPDTHMDNLHSTDPTLRSMYYMLTTRARASLHLGYLGDQEPGHLRPVPEGCLRRRL